MTKIENSSRYTHQQKGEGGRKYQWHDTCLPVLKVKNYPAKIYASQRETTTMWFHAYVKSNEQAELTSEMETDSSMESRLTAPGLAGRVRGRRDQGKRKRTHGCRQWCGDCGRRYKGDKCEWKKDNKSLKIIFQMYIPKHTYTYIHTSRLWYIYIYITTIHTHTYIYIHYVYIVGQKVRLVFSIRWLQ